MELLLGAALVYLATRPRGQDFNANLQPDVHDPVQGYVAPQPNSPQKKASPASVSTGVLAQNSPIAPANVSTDDLAWKPDWTNGTGDGSGTQDAPTAEDQWAASGGDTSAMQWSPDWTDGQGTDL